MQERQEPTVSAENVSPSGAANAPAAAPAPTRPTRTPRRRWLRWLLAAIAVLLITLCLLLGALWWWSGQSDSLGRTLGRVASWMPADQTLEATGVEGSLREGGRIAHLRWASPTMQVDITNADIGWSLQPLLRRQLKLGKVDMEELRIRSTPQPKDDTPTEPLESLVLPMQLDIPVRIARVVWEGPPESVITNLDGHYRYDGVQHHLDINSLEYAEGAYAGQVQLQARAPMQLNAQLQGTVKAPLPGQPDRSLTVHADAKVEGTLATEAAQLAITAKARTAPDSDLPAAQALAADVQATVRPWRSQPVEQAHATLQHVDVALFLPDGPRTDLNGTVQAGPDTSASNPTGTATAWSLRADMHNTLPGPWDRQALPVRQLQAHVTYDGSQLWQVHQAQVDVGASQGGSVRAQGSWNMADQTLQGQATLDAVNPAQIYTALAAAPLSGTLTAHTDADRTVQFALDVQAQGGRGTQGLRIDSARAQGSYAAPLLTLQQVNIQALQAQLQSPGLRLNTDTQDLQGAATVQVPGSRVALNGQIAPEQGQGQLQLQLTSGDQLAQWLRRLPGVADPLAGAQLQGSAQARLTWRGGWAALQQRLANPAAPRQASGLQLTGNVTAPRLFYRPQGGEGTELQQLQLAFSGSPEQLQAQLSTQARMGTQSLSVNTRLQGGLLAGAHAAATDWHAQLQQLTARWSPQGSLDNAWQLQLAQPVAASQRTTGNPVRSTRIEAGAGQLQITPPASAGSQTARVQWGPLVLRHSGQGQWGVQSQGQLQGVPLAWVDAFSPDPQQPLLANAGVGGDLVVQGRWDVDTTGRALRAQVQLERASGDIRLAVEDSDASNVTVVRSSGTTSAGADGQANRAPQQVLRSGRGLRANLQQLQLVVDAQGNALRAQLDMASGRAGTLRADITSQLRTAGGAISWPEQAPLGGTVRANLPNIGIWALFAPPGWRVTGTVDANLAIGGTRSAPQWDGSLEANGLSIRSVLDGVDLSDGRLRAKLAGTRMDITELFLRGGPGSSARILGQSGNLTPAPQDGGTLTGSGYVLYDAQAGGSGMRMQITAQARALQVLVRADRQLSVSGQLNASLDDGQVALTGNLVVDRAAILLGDSTAPKLDDDVRVHTAASRAAEAERAAQAQQQAERQALAEANGSVQAAKPPHIQLGLNLGPDFALQGYGITTRLKGQLQLTTGPRLTGVVETVNGRYRAWGQSLDVEEGTIRFSGPYANPAIDIVAIRPNIAVRAGVKVTGSANSPRVALFSEPEMSDAEKLSWVVMGRDANAGGAEAALLQQAALAMLSGGGSGENFAGRVGLDEIGIRGPSADGEEGAALTLGKRLSKDFYVSYEQSLSGAMGTLYIFYDLSRRLTLRGQTGEQTAVDLIYTRAK